MCAIGENVSRELEGSLPDESSLSVNVYVQHNLCAERTLYHRTLL